MIELILLFSLAFLIEETARSRRLNYKRWLSISMGVVLTTLALRFLTPYSIAFAMAGWGMLGAIYFYVRAHRLPKKKIAQMDLSTMLAEEELDSVKERPF